MTQTQIDRRTRTAPAADATPENVRFGVVSCSNLQAGWFASYRHLATREDLHAILHLGDYLYEYGPGEYGYGMANENVRPHEPARDAWMPLRVDGTAAVETAPSKIDGHLHDRIYRRPGFGNLLEVSMLDLRMSRPCPPDTAALCA
ncbi:alkaline phosphatase D family protein [Nocardioides sp. NPDC058538]|uniref:alkaline phosphatase D family protein n=1 Tax=Nocardioides sp. NPDC058538 TaxID=3346542 RepID=UPI00365BB35B